MSIYRKGKVKRFFIMADRRYSNSRSGSGGDIYGEMYDRELEKNQRMAERSRRSEKPDFDAGDERRRQNYRSEQYGGRQQPRRQSGMDGQEKRPDFRLGNGGFTGYDSGSSEPRSSSRREPERRSRSNYSGDNGYGGYDNYDNYSRQGRGEQERRSRSNYSGDNGYDGYDSYDNYSRQGRGEQERRTQSSYDDYSDSGSGYDQSPIIGRGGQDYQHDYQQDYRSQSASYSYTGAGGGSSRSGRGGDEDYRPQSMYNYAADSREPRSSSRSGEHRHHSHSHSQSRSFDDGHSRVKRYAEEAEHKHGNKQLAFGRYDHDSEKLNEVKTFSFGSFIKILFVIIVIVALLLQVLIVRYISMVKSVPTGRRTVTAAELSDSKVTNVLIIGSDNRGTDDEDHTGRTDSMILASINSRSKEVTLTSIMRDSYVDIPGRGWGKLNSAYAYGGAELVLDTVQQNFGIQIDKYVFVDFFSFITIIDAAGGINLSITDEEAQGMEPPLAEQNKYLKNAKGTDYLQGGGQDIQMNGNQALAYARLRYVGNADFERTDRQRIVINKLLEKAKTLSPLELDNFLKISCRELTTNMSGSEMYFFFYKLMFSMTYSRGEMRLPPDGTYIYGDHEGLSTLDLDFEACKNALRAQLYK